VFPSKLTYRILWSWVVSDITFFSEDKNADRPGVRNQYGPWIRTRQLAEQIVANIHIDGRSGANEPAIQICHLCCYKYEIKVKPIWPVTCSIHRSNLRGRL
jgi:hypothetical protein